MKMNLMDRRIVAPTAVVGTLLAGWLAILSTSAPALAAASDRQLGAPEPGQMGLQQAATDVMVQTTAFHDFLMIIMIGIVVLVSGLLLWVMIRFNKRSNPKPSGFSHNTVLEIGWSVVPVMILMVIAVPSFRLLYFQDTIPEADIVIKATGHQWSWTYEYPDEDGLRFDSNMLSSSYWDENLSEDIQAERAAAVADIQNMLDLPEAPEIRRLLDTDTRIVVPVGKTVKVLVAADDVLHAWAIPSFGVKIDAVPGRENQTWFKANATGTFYGQCSELCGIKHAFMPIVVEVVEEDEYEAWLIRAKSVYGTDIASTSRVAAASAAK